MIDFRLLGVAESPRSHVLLSNITERSPELAYCYTAGGRKLHLAGDDSMVTLCGSILAQLVLVETPVPDSAVCEWCRAAKEKR